MVATLHEFYRISFKARLRPQYFYGITLGVMLFAICYLHAIGKLGSYVFLGFLPLLISIFIIELYRNRQKPIHNIASTLLGIFYIAFPFALLNYFALSYASYSIGYKTSILIGFFVLTWANDSGAYAFGVSLGRNKLFPKVSPKKSWEGLIGGIFTTMLAAWILSLFYFEVSRFHWLTIGLIVAIMSVFGDLVASMFKRSVGVKDSGKFLPGHGGMLDRFDCMLLSVPVVFVYLEMMMLI